MEKTFETALAEYVAAIQAATNAKYATHYKSLTPPVISVMVGPKYVRVIKSDSFNVSAGGTVSRSVHSFVCKATGNILFPKGWKGPVTKPMGVRGSIYNANPMTGVNTYGPHYLKPYGINLEAA